MDKRKNIIFKYQKVKEKLRENFDELVNRVEIYS